jgi:hypothetical protein
VHAAAGAAAGPAAPILLHPQLSSLAPSTGALSWSPANPSRAVPAQACMLCTAAPACDAPSASPVTQGGRARSRYTQCHRAALGRPMPAAGRRHVPRGSTTPARQGWRRQRPPAAGWTSLASAPDTCGGQAPGSCKCHKRSGATNSQLSGHRGGRIKSAEAAPRGMNASSRAPPSRA